MKFLNKLLIDLFIWIMRLISWLPMPLTRLIGWVLGNVSYLLIASRRRVGLVNLRLCFPEKSEQERRKILRDHFCELFIIGLDYGLIFGASPARLQRLVKYRNFENIQKYYEHRPIVLLAPHLLGLDIGANRTSLEITGYSMFSHQRNLYLSERLKQARIRFFAPRGGEIFSRQEGLRNIVRKMKQNKWPFYYLPDQDMDQRNLMFVPFFAHPYCATVDVMPKLAKLADAVVIPMATYREGNHYVVEFWSAWEDYPTEDSVADVTRMNRAIEKMILKHPEQYLWMHKRFKTQPDLPRGELYKNC